MHVPQNLMWLRILKTFCFLRWTKQGLVVSGALALLANLHLFSVCLCLTASCCRAVPVTLFCYRLGLWDGKKRARWVQVLVQRMDRGRPHMKMEATDRRRYHPSTNASGQISTTSVHASICLPKNTTTPHHTIQHRKSGNVACSSFCYCSYTACMTNGLCRRPACPLGFITTCFVILYICSV